jgi:lipopolysaccharide export system permease protein
MKILSRYILRTHIAPFIFGSAVVLFLFLLQFFLKAIDDLMGKGLDLWVIAQLIGLNLAWMVVLAVPIGVLFSTLMSFGGMSSAHEVTIIKASGGSLIRMMFPVVLSGTLISILLFWFNDYILPESNHQAKVLMSDVRRKKPTFALESGQFSSELEGYTILARSVDSISGLLRGVTIYDHRRAQENTIVSADSGKIRFNPDYTKLIMTLYDGEIHQLYIDIVHNYRKINFKTHQILIAASGFSFSKSDPKNISRGDREMRIKDMQKICDDSQKRENESKNRINQELDKHFQYLTGKILANNLKNDFETPKDFGRLKAIPDKKTRKAKGKSIVPSAMPVKPDTSVKSAISNAQKRINFLHSTIQSDLFQSNEYDENIRSYTVEIQKKYAIPFACLVFALVGCPLGIMTKGGNFGISSAITLGFYIFYWACLIGGEKLADRGLMSPTLSMWLGNILIAIMGLILTIRINNESFNLPFMNLFKKIMSLFIRKN